MKEQFKEAEVELIEFCEDVIASSGRPALDLDDNEMLGPVFGLSTGGQPTSGQPTSDQPTSGQ